MKIAEIAGKLISRTKPFLILDAGVNHEGSLNKALEMIDTAAKAGADAIKFQSYKAETLASRNSPAYWDRAKEPADSQYKLFKKYDLFGDNDYLRLAKRCEEKEIIFMSTPFDRHFVDFLEPLMPVFKIASADITNTPFLLQVASKGKPIFLSVGASYLSEVKDALRIFAEAGNEKVALLHCVLEYPAKDEHANLLTIPYLRGFFPDHTIGWSDHVSPDHGCLSLLTAWLLGADILEKHFTLDKTLPGNDHYHAMNPDDVKEFIVQQQLIQSMLGVPEKTVFPWEEDSRLYARRSLVAACDIPVGTVITPEMIIPKRPGTGIPPAHYNLVVGRIARIDIKEDDILQWDMISKTG